MDEGAMDEGAMDEGAMDEGAMDEGAMDEGAMDADAGSPPRVAGAALWLYGPAWENGSELDAARPPMPFDEWAAHVRERGWDLSWTPMGAIDEGPYAGGVVVEADVDGDRGYAVIPPELLDRLQEIMPARDYEMVREDVANIDNPEARGYTVTRIDPAAWEGRRQVVPNAAPIPTETWAAVIRAHHMRVAPPVGNALSEDSLYPAGQVVAVDDAAGRSYFATPRAAYWLAYDLADETAEAGRGGPEAGSGEAAQTVTEAAGGFADGWTVATVLWIDPDAHERAGTVVPIADPLPVRDWVRIVRDEGHRFVAISPPQSAPGEPWDRARVVYLLGPHGRTAFVVPPAAQVVLPELFPDAVDAVGAGR